MSTNNSNSNEQLAQEIVNARLRAMTPSEKIHAALRLYYSARSLKISWLRAQNPQSSESEILQMVKESFMYART
jgi:hypothetical protein